MPDIIPTKDIKAALKAQIASALPPGTIVYPYNCLPKISASPSDADLEKWAARFRYQDASDGNKPKIHGWLIKRSARLAEELRHGCEDVFMDFDVWGFYGFHATSTDLNSDDEFDAIIDAVARSVNTETTFMAGSYEVQHQGISFPVVNVLRAGESRMHFAGGRITVFYRS